jgi:hypothetical protein
VKVFDLLGGRLDLFLEVLEPVELNLKHGQT